MRHLYVKKRWKCKCTFLLTEINIETHLFNNNFNMAFKWLSAQLPVNQNHIRKWPLEMGSWITMYGGGNNVIISYFATYSFQTIRDHVILFPYEHSGFGLVNFSGMLHILSWCGWNFGPQPIRSFEFGHLMSQGYATHDCASLETRS